MKRRWMAFLLALCLASGGTALAKPSGQGRDSWVLGAAWGYPGLANAMVAYQWPRFSLRLMGGAFPRTLDWNWRGVEAGALVSLWQGAQMDLELGAGAGYTDRAGYADFSVGMSWKWLFGELGVIPFAPLKDLSKVKDPIVRGKVGIKFGLGG